MKRLLFFPVFIFVLFFADIAYAQNTWRPRACLPGVLRADPAVFSIGNIGYTVGGSTASSVINEVWAYDETTNIWTQKNNFPISITAATAFVINGVAYVGLGKDGANSYHTEFWKYDDVADQWTPVAPFTGAARWYAMSFALNGKGYVGCGSGVAYYNDFYEYNPVTDAWTIKAVFPGSARRDGFGGAVNGIGYIGMGADAATAYFDVYKYEPLIDTWTQVANFAGLARSAIGYFALNNTMYVAGGMANGNFYDECWRYDDVNNDWVQEPGFTCIQSPEIVNSGFTINGHAFITCGSLSNGSSTNNLSEFGLADNRFIQGISVLGNDTAICGGFSLTLSAGNACTEWSTGAVGAQITVTTPGSYSAIWATSCAMETDTLNITNGPPLPFYLGADTVYCSNFTRTLSSGNSSTVWSTGAAGSQIVVNSAGTYFASASNSCGSIADTIVISQGVAPVLNLGPDTMLCGGQALLLDATTANATYRWQDNSASATYSVTIAGTYSVTVNTAGCAASDTVVVQYSSGLPVVDLGKDQSICDPNGVVLNVPVPNAHFMWNDNSTDSFYHVTTSGTYSVTVTTGCGSVTDAVKLDVYPDECVLLIPTAFSPNGDGVNDVFHAIDHCPVDKFAMNIYDRWGELVYTANDILDGWDGTFKNHPAEMGVFVYYIEYFNYCEGKIKKVVGDVTLLR